MHLQQEIGAESQGNKKFCGGWKDKMGRGERKGGRRIPRCLWPVLSKMKEVGIGRGERGARARS